MSRMRTAIAFIFLASFALRGDSCNDPPEIPLKPTVASDTPTTVSGTRPACVDDGLGGLDPCIGEVRAYYPSTTMCTSACSCTVNGLPNDTPESVDDINAQGGWTLTGLPVDTEFALYSTNFDGHYLVCSSDKTIHTTPTTRGGCYKFFLWQNTDVPASFLTTIGNSRGARADWRAQNMTATDTATGGFAQQVLFVSVDNEASNDKWIEVGVTRGFQGNNSYQFFAARGDNTVTPEVFQDFAISGAPTPAVNVTTYQFEVRNCSGNSSGCGGASSTKWVACVQQWCRPFTNQGGPGTKDFRVGYEVSCGALDSVNKSKVDDILYRHIESWVRINNGGFAANNSHFELVGFPASAFEDPFSPDYPSDPTGPHILCCGNTLTNPDGSRYCQDPHHFLYWHNSQTPVSAFCQ